MDIIDIKYLKKQYSGTYVLKGINLSFEKRTIVGYIGPNGAGKSTTIKILTGIIDGFRRDLSIMALKNYIIFHGTKLAYKHAC